MQYELTFLLNEEAELKVLKELLKSLSVKLLSEENWGKKTLAYPIKKNIAANFYSWILETEAANLAKLRQKLDYNEKLIRYLLLQKEVKKTKLKVQKTK